MSRGILTTSGSRSPGQANGSTWSAGAGAASTAGAGWPARCAVDARMLIESLVAHLSECRRRVAELRGRADCRSLRVAIFRVEGPGHSIFDGNLFLRALRGRDHVHRGSVPSDDNPFALAFFSEPDALGKAKPTLTTAESNVVKALMAHGKHGLTED